MAGPKTIDIRVHPNMPAGTALMTSRTLPYPLSNVGNVIQVRTRQDYYQIEWPPRASRYETGVYADEVLQNYFPPSMAMISNISAGSSAVIASEAKQSSLRIVFRLAACSSTIYRRQALMNSLRKKRAESVRAIVAQR